MKFTIFALLFFLNITSGFAQALQRPDPSAVKIPDSINVFYKELFKTLKRGYLDRKHVDWQTLERDTYAKLISYQVFSASLQEITGVLDYIKADHAQVYHAGVKYTATRKVVSKQLYSDEWKAEFERKPVFEVKMLDGKYAYVLLPRIIAFDGSAESLRKIAQPLYDEVAKFKNNDQVKGWIIDLRFNTGGNVAPMLLALYDLLGDNVVWTELNENKKIVGKYKLNQGSYIYHSKAIASIQPDGRLIDKDKVALITGPFTASSGEVTALAFKGRKNTIFIGDDTAGYTTANTNWPLPYNSFIALTIGYDGDRGGHYYSRITPDIVISRKDNFKDLLSDENVQEAIRFIDAK